MKKSRLIILVLFIVSMLVWWSSRTKPSTQTVLDNATSSTLEKTDLVESSGKPVPSVSSQVSNDLETLQAESFRKLTNAIYEEKSEWRTPIEFYGKVVDEASNSVANADIHFVWTDISPKGTSEKKTTSDPRGVFFLRTTGKVLTVQVSKQGYYSYQNYPVGFFYAGENENFVPDPNNPVVFRLHKRGQAEPLIATEFPGFAQIEQLRRDGTPVEVNLSQAAKVSSGGQIKMEFWGDPVQKTNRVFNWKVRISVPGGGIAITTEEFNFNAPERSYLPYVETEMLASSEQWETSIKHKYFIKLADGNYGRIDFDFLARNGVYRIHSYINPSGSRNLEYNEAVQPKPVVQE